MSLKIYVLVDAETGQDLAFHIRNGETLYRWRRELENDGRQVRVEEREQEDEP